MIDQVAAPTGATSSPAETATAAPASPAEPGATPPAGSAGRRRWFVLATGTLAQAATSMYQFGLPSVLPQIRSELGVSLGQAALVIVCPSLGLVGALIAWGAVADRYGERLTMTIGLAATTVTLGIAGTASTPWGLGLALVAAGATGAAVNAASGRAVAGWFGAHERGVAMGARQTAQPIGVGAAAVILPAAAGPFGYRGAMLVAGAVCLAAGLLVAGAVKDPPRAPRAPGLRPPSPYRGPTLWRIHGASAMLIVPQFTMATFGFVFLVGARHWSAGAAGVLIGVANAAGALARLLAGFWSDRVSDRLGPMRTLALGNGAVVGLLAASAAAGGAASPALLAAAVTVTVSGNGLAFTSVAELAGPQWSGRALGAHNTAQSMVSLTAPPVLGLVIAGAGYPVGFAVAAAFAVAAIAVIPGTAGAATWGLPGRR